MTEQIVGRLWVHSDDAGRYLGGVTTGDIPSGAHVRLRKTGRTTKAGADEYALLLVDEPERKAGKVKQARAADAKLSPSAYDPNTIYSFILDDLEKRN
jgi:hypothetical protein